MGAWRRCRWGGCDEEAGGLSQPTRGREGGRGFLPEAGRQQAAEELSRFLADGV